MWGHRASEFEGEGHLQAKIIKQLKSRETLVNECARYK